VCESELARSCFPRCPNSISGLTTSFKVSSHGQSVWRASQSVFALACDHLLSHNIMTLASFQQGVLIERARGARANQRLTNQPTNQPTDRCCSQSSDQCHVHLRIPCAHWVAAMCPLGRRLESNNSPPSNTVTVRSSDLCHIDWEIDGEQLCKLGLEHLLGLVLPNLLPRLLQRASLR